MKIKPVISDHIHTHHTSFEVDFQLENNITLISGESGSGRSVVFSILQEFSVEDKRIKCFNYLDQNKNYKSAIKQSKGKLFVIDNADILLDDSVRSYIALDGDNQYIIIGRNPTGLLLTLDEIYELKSTTSNGETAFTLTKGI